ncbi:hypothetical protein [Rhizobium sp. RU36D]|uniref:hypothetical protein n=1 Tax=Rhizobium sp. RU36D TaxID=1907415 RepID=UPI0009D8053C|nr:hypothetical protein [Rhizobium sp. RU36D]SMC58366.1 hypothetical protein SAMN05880593_10363 [Rhizobium sp. RU36D]
MSTLPYQSSYQSQPRITIRTVAAFAGPLLLCLVGLAIAVGMRLMYAMSAVNSI